MRTEQDNHDGILATVRDYLDGMVFADEVKLRRALHPQWFCIGNFDGDVEWDSRDVFIAGAKANAAPPKGGKYYSEVLSVDITGDTAAVKVANDYLEMRFTDYLTLLRRDGTWVIVNKVFHHHPG